MIRNNIFCGATDNAFYAPAWPEAALRAMIVDHNCWYQPRGDMVLIGGKKYGMDQFSRYQSDWKLDTHSLTAKPRLLDPATPDWHLAPDSPCIDAGADVGIRADFEGTPIPQGARPDIGADER